MGRLGLATAAMKLLKKLVTSSTLNGLELLLLHTQPCTNSTGKGMGHVAEGPQLCLGAAAFGARGMSMQYSLQLEVRHSCCNYLSQISTRRTKSLRRWVLRHTRGTGFKSMVTPGGAS